MTTSPRALAARSHFASSNASNTIVWALPTRRNAKPSATTSGPDYGLSVFAGAQRSCSKCAIAKGKSSFTAYTMGDEASKASRMKTRAFSDYAESVLPVMPGLVPGIHVFRAAGKDVDGRDKPGHDEWSTLSVSALARVPAKWTPVRRQGHAPTHESIAFSGEVDFRFTEENASNQRI